MLVKQSHSVSMPVIPLNHPEGWEIYNLPKQIKMASTKDSKNEDLGGFDLKAATKEHPDNLYIKIFAIKKDEVNDNGDAFSEKELKKATDTFVGVPLFTNHQNDDVEKARGECVHSWYDKEAGGIYIIGRIDKVAYPKLARGIETGIIKGTSMGTSVDFSCCSVCHNFAKVADDFCDHIKERKNRKYSGDIKCRYHEHRDSEGENCPLCSSKKDDIKTLSHTDQLIYEHNYGLKFIENSFVVNPACHDCGVECVLHIPELQKKVANARSSIDAILKYATDILDGTDVLEAVPPDKFDKDIEKFGGVHELQSLKKSMDDMESVVNSMLQQKENVSMDYVSDLVKAMADVQNIYDELNEMGYGRLPSPPISETMEGDVGINTTTPAMNAFPQPQLEQPSPASSPQGVVSNPELGGLGSITKPKLSSKINRKIKDFLTGSKKLTNKVSSFRDNLSKLQIDRRKNMAAIVTKVSSDTNDRQVVISKEDDGIFVTETNGEEILKVSNINQYPEEMRNRIENNPEEAAKELLKEIGAKMTSTQTKVAAGLDNQEIITEKQLEKKEEPLHSRIDESYEGITESKEQIGRETDIANVTTSESPQNRKGSYETITEDQLKDITSGYVVRWDDMLDVITEKQWTDMSRLISAKLPDDYTEAITDKQMRDLLESHTYCGPVEVITEKQFADRINHQDLSHWARNDYAKSLVKTATSTIADAMAKFDNTKEDIEKVCSFINSSPERKEKVIVLTLINNLPWKQSGRNKVAQDFSFNKLASKTNSVTPLDAFIIAIADRATFPQKAEDLLDTINHVLKSKKAMSQVEEKIKLAKEGGEENIKKADLLENAIKALDKPEDGKYRIHATLEDIGVPVTNKVAFHKALKKFAQEQIDDGSVAAAIIKLEVGPNGELIIDIEDGAEEEICPDDIGDIIEGPVEEIGVENGEEGEIIEETKSMEEEQEEEMPMASAKKDTKLAAAREEIKKKAQMMGGEMGGQGGVGQGPGAGATLPQPGADPATQPPLESFSDEGDMLGEDDEFDEDCEPNPPGTTCVVCSSKDVDVVDGNAKCNCCGAEMKFKVAVDVTKWPGITPDSKTGGEEEEGIGEGEGFALPEEEEAPLTPPAVASVVNLKPNVLQKVANIKKQAEEISGDKEKIKKLSEETGISVSNLNKIAKQIVAPGNISPETGNVNTLDLKDGTHVCLASGKKYKVSFVTDTKGKGIYGQWEWRPTSKMAISDCPSCYRSKRRFAKALSSVDITEEKFNKMDLSKKVDAISKLKKAGKLGFVKIAEIEGNVVEDFKLAYGNYGDKFPIEDCVERVARRFGKNALAISGPCEGKNLADCLCNSLKQADVYSGNLAVKLAESWNDCDGDDECVTHQVRQGYDLREAAAICTTLKLAVATPEDIFASQLKMSQELPMDEGPVEEDIDPFENDELGGMEDEGVGGEVTISLPMDVVEKLDKELDVALGENPAEEEHHEDTDLDGVPDIAEEPVGTDVVEEITPEDISEEGNIDTNDMSHCKSVTPEEGVEFENEEPTYEDEGSSGKVIVNDNTSGNNEETNDMAYMASQKEGEFEYKEASLMKSKIGKTGTMKLDLSSVAKAINKTAGEKTIEHKNVQDVSEIGTYTAGEEGSKMGHENETIPSATVPSVPRNNATMGQEPSDLNPQDKPQPSIPSENATMGHEDEAGLSGGDASYTGGDDGAGKATTTASREDDEMADVLHMRGFGSTSSGLDRLARRILEAGEKKLDTPAPVADDKDIQPISGNSTMGKEEKLTLEKPENVKGSGNESQMGHENESLGDRPDSPSDHPTIPADKQTMGQEGEDIAPEKQTKNKGTVLAEQGERESEAYRVAGKMLEHGKISANELQQKISELSSYKPAQIRDIERGIFASEKGLDTGSDGKLAQAVIINEASNERSSRDDLSQKLSNLFTMEQRNKWADSDESTQLRRTFGRN